MTHAEDRYRPTDGPPGNELQTAWVELSTDETYGLLGALKAWAEEVQEGHADPGWHAHFSDDSGRELTVSIRQTQDDTNP